MLFFNNNIISRVENDYVKLKRALKTSIENFKKIINIIDLLLKNQRSVYIIAHEKFKSRLAKECTREALQNLQKFYNSYALRLIRKSLHKLNSSDSLFSCTEVYRSSMRLSCAHKIQTNSNSLNEKDVYSHWQIFDWDVNRNIRVSKSKIANDEDMRDDNHQKDENNQKTRIRKTRTIRKKSIRKTRTKRKKLSDGRWCVKTFICYNRTGGSIYTGAIRLRVELAY
jgi:hypothetical protein